MIDRFIKVLTNKPTDLDGPKFTKEFIPRTKSVEELEALLKIAEDDSKVLIENEIKKIKYGSYGEHNVYYELKNSFIPMVCLHDVRIEYKGLYAQIDFIAITPKKIYTIECKNIVGDILITDKGEFIRYKKDSNGNLISKEGMYSPIVQNERHMNLLKELLKDKLKYKKKLDRIDSLVVIANSKAVINKKYAPKNIQEKIIRYDQLIDILKSDEQDKTLDWVFIQSDIMEISDCIKSNHKDLAIDYSKKFKIKKNVVKEKKYKNDEELMKMLKEYRLNVSRRDEIKAYVVFTNKIMEEMINIKPKCIEELKSIKGFGDSRCEKYGKDIIEIIN